MIDGETFAAFCICPHSVATSCDFMFWLHCLHVILTDTLLPLEGAVSTVSVTLSKWIGEIQTGGSTGTKEWHFLLALCGANLCLPVQLQLCFSWQCNSVSIQSDSFPCWILQSFYLKNWDRFKNSREHLNIEMTKLGKFLNPSTPYHKPVYI